MKEILIILALLAAFLFGSYSSYAEMRDKIKELTGYDHVQLKEMKEECEKSLPRDRFCTIKLEVKPDEES